MLSRESQHNNTTVFTQSRNPELTFWGPRRNLYPDKSISSLPLIPPDMAAAGGNTNVTHAYDGNEKSTGWGEGWGHLEE